MFDNPFIEPFAKTIRGYGVTGQTVTISDRTPNPGEYIQYSRITYVDETTANADLRVGIKHLDNFTTLFYSVNVTPANVPVSIDLYGITVKEGDNLEVRIADTVDGDILKLHLHGKVVFDERLLR